MKYMAQNTLTYTFHYSQLFFILWNTEINWIKFEPSKPAGSIRPVQISSYGYIYQYYLVSLTCFWLYICCVYRYIYYISLLLLLWPVNIYFILLALGLVIIIIVCLKYTLTNYIYMHFQKMDILYKCILASSLMYYGYIKTSVMISVYI